MGNIINYINNKQIKIEFGKEKLTTYKFGLGFTVKYGWFGNSLEDHCDKYFYKTLFFIGPFIFYVKWTWKESTC